MFGMSKAGAAGKKATAKAASKKPVLVSVTVKLEASQRDKLKALGGDSWLRERIDAADKPDRGDASAFAVDDEDH